MADDSNAIQRMDQKIDNLSTTVNRLSQQFSDYLATQLQQQPENDQSEAVDNFTQDFSKDENEERGNWSGRLDFMLSCLGYAVGLGNVWRFPYLCYKNGGAVFLIPYVIMLTFVGMPLFFMELAIGQYTSRGPLNCWNMAKFFSGIGVGMLCVSIMVASYYNMIIAWAIFYLFASFTSDLPWQYCDREWNTEWCALNINTTIQDPDTCEMIGLRPDADGVCYNITSGLPAAIFNTTLAAANNKSAVVPSEEYLKRYVWGTHEADGVDDLGGLRWQLVLCLLLATIIVFFSLIKGVKSSGKVVYFTALFPYAVLVVLLIRGLTLDGYYDGIKFYILEPDLSKLFDAQVWKDAAVQIFFSLGTSWGGLVTLSSYNRFHNNILRDTFIISIGNCLTSVFAGFVIFSYLGFLANEYKQSVEDVADSGVGLAFIVYPEAVSRMPLSTLWAILFFLMLITLGLDTQFGTVETVTTALSDFFPRLRRHKTLLIGTASLVFFMLGLILCTNGGSWILSLVDNYAGGWNMLLIGLLQCICVTYVYGAFRFKEDISCMIGKTGCGCFSWNICFPWWLINWAFLTPFGILFIMIFSWVDYKPYTDFKYTYPVWANTLGWLMTLTVVVAVVVVPIILFCQEDGSFSERLRKITTPTKYWGPALPKHRRLVKHLGPDFQIDPEETNSPGLHSMEQNKAGEDNFGYVSSKM